MRYVEFEPAPALAAHVACYWGMTAGSDTTPGTAHHLIPDGCVSLVAGLSAAGVARAALLGPRAEALSVPLNPGDRYWGVRFWPDAAGVVLGLVPRDLAGKVIAPLTNPAWAATLLRSLATSADETAAAAMADGALAGPVAAAPPIDDVVRQAVVAIVESRGEVAIAELARDVGLGPRQLERRFSVAVGLAPKQYARLRRLRAALTHLLDPTPRTWSEIAAEFGYADHAHLSREVGDLAGLTPSALAERVRAIRHDSVRP